MARDDSLETYSDVLVKAFGPSARTLIHSMCTFLSFPFESLISFPYYSLADLDCYSNSRIRIGSFRNSFNSFILRFNVNSFSSLGSNLVQTSSFHNVRLSFLSSWPSLFPFVLTPLLLRILPTTFLPLRFLSMTSLIGILSSFTLLFVLIADGTIKKEAPGSLWDPAMTSLGPRWMRLPLSFGLFMSGVSNPEDSGKGRG